MKDFRVVLNRTGLKSQLLGLNSTQSLGDLTSGYLDSHFYQGDTARGLRVWGWGWRTGPQVGPQL